MHAERRPDCGKAGFHTVRRRNRPKASGPGNIAQYQIHHYRYICMRQASDQEAAPNAEVFPGASGAVDDAAPKPSSASTSKARARRLASQSSRSYQMTRMRRLFLPCLFSLLYLLALVVFYVQGLVARPTVFIVAAVIGVAMAAFYYVFARGLNQRAREKNLTAPLALCALATMLGVAYAAPATRIIFTPFVFLVIAFGTVRLPQKNVLLLSIGTLAGYAAVVGLHHLQSRDGALLQLELLHWLGLALTLPGVALLVGPVQKLRRALFQAGMKIKNIEQQARLDELVGCYNRRHTATVLEQQKQLADVSGADLCLAVIDLDHFKRVNDEVGHLAGDEVLRTFARVALDHVRQGDVFGRYGGEEFLLILPHTSLLAALNIAERIREQVEVYPWSGKLRGAVTVSIGLTRYIPGESVLDLFSRTDTAMYLAKRGGRNQVVVQEPAMELWPAA